MPSSFLTLIFTLAVLLPGIGLTFFPHTTCTLFEMPADTITTSTLHLSRIIGVRNITFGLFLLLLKPQSAEHRSVIKLAAVTEAADVAMSVLSWWTGDMGSQQAIQSGGAAAVVALAGWGSL